MIIVRTILAVALAIVPAATQPRTTGQQLRLTPDEIRALPSISAGAGTSGVGEIITSVLARDPKTSEPHTIALEVPANMRIATHTHTGDRVATVISGT